MASLENATIYFGDFCGASPFWDQRVSWYTSSPDLTLCFLDTIPTWVPSIFLLFALPLFLKKLIAKISKYSMKQDGNSRCHYWLKQMVIGLATAITLAELALVVEGASSSASSTASSIFYASAAPLVNRSMLVVSLIIVAVLTRLSRYSSSASAVVLSFWLLHFLGQLLRLQHYARANLGSVPFLEEVLEKKILVTVSLMTIMSFVSLSVNLCQSWNLTGSSFDSASALSRLTFFWLTPLLWRGFKKPLDNQDLEELPKELQIEQIMTKFYEEYFKNSHKDPSAAGDNKKNDSEVKFDNCKNISSVNRILLWRHIQTLFFLSFLRIIFILNELGKPLILGWLLNHLSIRPTEGFDSKERESEWYWKGAFYVALIFVLAFTLPYCINQFWLLNRILSLKVQSILTIAIFDKSLRLTSAASQAKPVGEIVNLMSVDARKFFDGLELFIIGIFTPLHILLGTWIIYSQVGVSVFAGLAVFVVFLPICILIGNKTKTLQEKHMEFKDERVKKISEVLNSIKILKFYAWEGSFIDQINQIRDSEVKMYRVQLLWHGFIKFFIVATPIFLIIVLFSVFVLLDDRILTAKRAFVTLSVLHNIRVPLWVLPMSLISSIHMFVSGKRIDAFLVSEEFQFDSAIHQHAKDIAVNVTDASFAWNKNDEPFLKSLNFKVKNGQMIAIVGRVGSGKSALLKAILGEIHRVQGIVRILKKVSYVSQQPWIQNGTIKDNILFGKPLDAKKYHSVITACALQLDLKTLPASDDTEIGDRGINLSGGQKLRVSLARAIYADADLYLLDDPLSAVDAHVGKHIYDKVLSFEGLLGTKSRIIVTNVLNYLPAMDNILFLEDGRILEKGKYADLIGGNGYFSQYVKNFRNQLNEKKYTAKDQLDINQSNQPSLEEKTTEGDGKLIQDEERQHGFVSFQMFIAYLASSGKFVTIMMFLSFIVARVLEMTSNFQLSKWTDEIQNRKNSTVLTVVNSHNLSIYVGVGLGASVLIFIAIRFHIYSSIGASRRLHEYLVKRVLSCPLTFFDITPLGRIMNRFSVDMDGIDVKIPEILFLFYNTVIFLIGTPIVIAIVKPWFLVPAPFFLGLFFIVQRFSISSTRQLRRIESITRSPIFSLFAETLQGLVVIRAFGKQNHFKEEIRRRVKENLKSAFLMWTVDEWMTFVIEQLASPIILFSTLSTILDTSTTVSDAGLTIAYAVTFVHIMTHVVRKSSEMENEFVAVERVREYSTLPVEAPWRNDRSDSLKNIWPDQGDILFKNYNVKYRENLELVLKNINLRITGGQRIGVVGRTGAGKSSLTLALFRILEAASGSIVIDGEDTQNLGLHDLRSKISIIPQDPIIFSGSLRMNLDPFNLHADEELWRVLTLSHLKDFISSLPEGLSHQCAESGENLSVGQRQLVCLARALLRDSEILVLDEATAAVDVRTDELIQKTIAKEFGGATVLTIAHRINTILDYDKVIVMHQGEVIEFEDPSILIEDETSVFYGLAKDAGVVL